MKPSYFPLHLHSHYSLLDGLSRPEQIAKRIDTLELDGCAITEHGNLASSVQMQRALKKKGKKSVLGCELYLSNLDCTIKKRENRKLFHQVVLAKNMEGWKELLRITAHSNDESRVYYKPRLDLKYFEDNPVSNLITFSGHLGSHLSNVAQASGKEAAIKAAEYLRDLFGKDNFYIEIQRIDMDANPDSRIVSEILREVSVATGIPCLGTADSHYCSKEDAEDQRVLLCRNLNTTFARVQHALNTDETEVGLGCFFRSTNFHIPSYEEMKSVHTDDELDNTLKVASEIEDFNLIGKPILPPFECPNGMSEADYLRQLCRDGWANKIQGKISKEEQDVYVDRIKMELGVLQGAGLSGYFLILEDIARYVRSNGWLVGPGRGSAAGCFTSYLVGITSINPIVYSLLFERFYNSGRNTADHVSFPDIDLDIPVGKRDRVIQYIKTKYGVDRVAQMAVYQTMRGRSAIKDVLRAHGNIPFEEMNKITSHIPDGAEIAGDLQEMMEETGEASIIMWALENRASKLKEWCYISEDGSLDGPLSKRFEQAIRLEGTKTAQGRHASGVVIAPDDLNQICPMILDSEKNMIAGMEMADLESLGLIKLDILGLNLLDKISGIKQILATGDIYDD